MASRRPEPMDRRSIRCAIYTRKSTEEGLDQEFNSLDAQREACTAYILSQRHEGWSLVDEHYDDGGFSGGNMERPGLKQLLADIEAGKVDVIVVYKVDRLTRAFSDFAKIVEILDAKGASFVSITQSFNTTTSMGRLTLNVLLSFAQFEREVIGERVRDKIAASKRKGMWMGGPIPLGYDVIDRKLVANETEAATVQLIMSRYLELGSVRETLVALDREDIRTKATISKRGEPRGGIPFQRGALYHLLSNPIYIGLTSHRGETFPGCHAAIVSMELWEQVQARLKANAAVRTMPVNVRHMSLLAGMIRDDQDRPMSPDHANKGSVRYRYYRSAGAADGASRRVCAVQAEKSVLTGLIGLLSSPATLVQTLPSVAPAAAAMKLSSRACQLCKDLTDASPAQFRALLIDVDATIIMGDGHLSASISAVALARQLEVVTEQPNGIRIPLVLPKLDQTGSHGLRIALSPDVTLNSPPDGRLLTLLLKARAARTMLTDCAANVTRAELHHATRMARLAYLAPDIVAAILDGTQPTSLSARKLLRISSLPLDWSAQRHLLGFV